MWCERLVGTRLLYAWKFCQTLSSLYQNKGSNVEANLTIQNDGVEANCAYKDDKTDHVYIHNDTEANFGYKDDDFNSLADITHLNAVDCFEHHN